MNFHIPDKDSKQLLVIVGPTAVGKTALSLGLAEEFNGEIISADSRLFYRGMDIGTDKPSERDRTRITHHMIDICQPDETITLGEYLRSANQLIEDIQLQGKLPVLVGGTGQYVRAILEGWSVPEVTPQLELRQELELFDDPELYRWLVNLDPDSATKIDQKNRRRIIRALEVTLMTGTPMSKAQKRENPGHDGLLIGLTCNRDVLYQRIDERVTEMMDDGFLAEVEKLRNSGYRRDLPAMSGLGYRQLWAYLEGEFDLDEAIERIMFETHRFARQQYNWFRIDNSEIHWFDVQQPGWQKRIHLLVGGWVL